MPQSSALLLSLLYPAAIYLIPEPIAAREGWKAARFVPLSGPLKERSEKNGRYLLTIKLALIAGLTLYLARTYFPSLLSTRTLAHDLPFAFAIGLLAGLLLSVVQLRIGSWFPRTRQLLDDHPMTRGPWQFWAIIILAGALAEELWRTLSLEALKTAGFNVTTAAAITSLAYALAQLGGIPPRLLGIWEDVAAAAAVGLALAILFLAYGSIVANFEANLIFNLLKLYTVRRMGRGGWRRDKP